MSFILMWCSKFQTQSDGKTYPHIYYKQCDRIFLTEQGNIPRNVWMPCQGKAAMLFWVKLTCCLRERKISMKVQLDLQRWTPLRHSWVNHVFRAVGLLRSRLTVIFLHNSRRLLPAPITPQTRPASLSLIAEQFPFVQQDCLTFQCASFHPFQSYNCACASLAVWLCNLGGNSDSKGVLLCHCVSGIHRNSLLGWRMWSLSVIWRLWTGVRWWSTCSGGQGSRSGQGSRCKMGSTTSSSCTSVLTCQLWRSRKFKKQSLLSLLTGRLQRWTRVRHSNHL